MRRTLTFAAAALAAACAHASGELQDAQREAMKPLAILDGTWRGPATVLQQGGKRVEIVQTERVGPMLDGSVKVIEGRGYMPDGSLHFNAFAVISYEPDKKAYNFRSYAHGRQGDFPFEARPDGFTWWIKAGPATIRYTTTIKDGTWHEIGERVMEGQPALKIFEMTLRKVGTTDWPAQGAIQPK